MRSSLRFLSLFARRPALRKPAVPAWAVLSALIAAGVATSLPAAAVKVTGRVSGYEMLESPALLRSRDPALHAYSFREPTPSVPAKFRRPFPLITRELCVALIAEEPQKPKPLKVIVSGGRATPSTVVVAPGTPIEFSNADPFEHRLYAVDVKDFPASDTADGGSRQWIAPATGTFEVRDEVTPSFQMWIVVEPNVVSVAYPSINGVFSMQSELPGMHRVQAYFAGKPVGKPFAFNIAERDMDVSGAPLDVTPPKKAKK